MNIIEIFLTERQKVVDRIFDMAVGDYQYEQIMALGASLEAWEEILQRVASNTKK